MIKTTAAYKEALKEKGIFHHKVIINFPDGSNDTVEDLDIYTFQISEGTSNTSSFDLGAAIAQQLTLKLNNIDGRFDEHDFNGAVITAQVGLELLNGSVEWLDKGKFTAEPGEESGNSVSVKAFDDMTKFDRPYSLSELVYPATLGAIVRDACSCCGVTLASDTAAFDNDNFVVQNRPDDSALTFRQVLQWAGQIACKFFRINRFGKLSAQWYDTELLESTWIRKENTIWTDIDGNAILDMNGQEIRIDAGKVLKNGNSNTVDVDATEKILKIDDLLSGSTIQTDDVVITGIRVMEEGEEGTEEITYQSGADGYVLEISGNKLIQKSSGATVAAYLGERLNGVQFRPMSVSTPADPAREAGDIGLVIDAKKRYHKTIFTNVEYTAHTSQNLISGAEAPTRLSSTRYSQATQVYKELRANMKRQKTEWDTAFGNLQDAMKTKNGLFPIHETMGDGSTILYFCDKPELSDATIVVKFSAAGWGMSTDGGKTWNSGWLVDGTMIATILNVIGINAKWINAGALAVKDSNGKLIFEVDMDKKSVYMDPDTLTIGGMSLSKKLQSMDENIASARNMTLQLSNDMQTITSDSDGNIPVFPSVSTRATVMYGTQDITGDCSFTVTVSESISGSWNEATHTYTVKGLTADDGWVDIKATYLSNLSITKRFTISKQRSGKPGSAGKGIKGTPKSQYQVSESGTTAPTGAWSDTIPTVPEGKYLWTKTVTEYTDGTSTTGYSVSHIGKNGAEGNGVTGTEVAYQASDNGTTPPTGEWSKNPPESKPGQYIWTRVTTTYSKGDPVISYSVGKIGENGKQLYTWRKYALRPDGMDMTDSPEYTVLLDTADTPLLDAAGQKIYAYAEAVYVGIADNKTTETPSDNPKDYIWSRFRGEDGADGIGIPGENGETSYIHTAYANSPDGIKDFSTTNSDRIYIGHYTDFEKPDSSDPGKYTWARMRGEDGVPGRTYYLRANAEILLMGQNKKVSPNKLSVNAYYRDGQGPEKEFAGWWKAERSSDSGETWTTITLNQTKATSTCSITSSLQMIGSRGVIRVTCYLDESKTSIADMQTYSVALDVAALTQEQIVEILSNDGEWKGLYYLKGHLYISLDALLGNCATLGGKKNGNGYLKIQDDKGIVKGLIDYSGYTVFTNYEENSEYMKYTGVQFSSDGILPVDFTKYFGSNLDIEVAATDWGISWDNGELIVEASEVSAGTGEFKDLTATESLTAKKCDLEIANMKVSGPCTFDDEENEPLFKQSFRVQGFGFTTAGWNAWISNTDYRLRAYGSSSERYKILGASLSEEFIENLYNIEPIMARYRDGYLEEHDERAGVYFPMFRAEDVDKYFPLAVDHIDGKAENWNERIMIPAMFAMLKQQKREIEKLKRSIRTLKGE
ncbi:hypothetical protein [Blautia sp. MSJ-19]|uniref:hypothetical protein n=1 Tax=Blautia sp. MSJ-19 TaxID=2841517 RepID=UPI001C0F008E|nr:hypothetical protein [Blautia sp. MSJ-19]MBU5480882.1 hypothetical protein [Blautia sp. MSJ-19]